MPSSRKNKKTLPKELAAFLENEKSTDLVTPSISEPSKPSTPQIDLTNEHKKKRHWIRNTILVILVLFVVGAVAFGVYAYSLTKNQIVDKENQTGFIGQVQRILDKDVEPLQGEDEDRINILLLGQGGANHEGGTLADTIMVASIQPSTKKVALLSIPRDLQVGFYLNGSTIPSYYKINSSTSRGGVNLAIEKVEEVTGLDLHYYVLIDFAGFRDVIDTLGGIDVYVENGFTDREYPDYNFGYQTISFKVGVQHMEGEKALQFARSRHGNNGEGSDFARARRQQKILEATREKALSASTLFNPAKISGLMNDLGNHVATNIEIWEMTRFAKFAQELDTANITNAVIDTSPNGLLTYSDGWMIPAAGLDNYTEIHALAASIFTPTVTPTDNVNASQLVTLQKSAIEEKAKIVVQNGSSIAGLAAETSDEITAQGLTVESIGNALVKTTTKSIVYDLTNGAEPATASLLQTILGATVIKATVPATDSAVRLGSDLDPEVINMSVVTSKTDFVVLVGSASAD